MIISRGFSLTNFIIGTSALSFQMFVLYPWHERLDQDFKDLKAEHLRALYEGQSERSAELLGIQEEIKKLRKQRLWTWE
jgi:hypothetical protein